MPSTAHAARRTWRTPTHIPQEALAKILQRLVKAGLLHSQHGTNGGYTLARDPGMISAFEVIRAIDGPLFITSCVTVRGECDQSDRCNIREPLRRVSHGIEELLRRITILEMKEEPADPRRQGPQRPDPGWPDKERNGIRNHWISRF